MHMYVPLLLNLELFDLSRSEIMLRNLVSCFCLSNVLIVLILLLQLL